MKALLVGPDFEENLSIRYRYVSPRGLVRTYAACVVCVLMLTGGAARSDDLYSELSGEQRETFRRFDTLGFPNVKDCRFVRVGTGEWSQSGNRPRENRYINAFLLKTETNAFTVLTLDLLTRTFFNTGPGTAECERVFYDEKDLRTEAGAYLKQLRSPRAEEDYFRRFGEVLSERAEVFVLAWGCAKNGLAVQTRELYSEAAKMKGSNRGSSESSEPATVAEALEQDIGHAMMWRGVLAFEDPSISRKDLLARFEDIVANYPKSEHLARAKETADLLKQMVKEDAEQAKKARKPWDKMTTDERVAELIFQLRDQNGHQWSQPGSCDIFEDYAGKTNSPAHQLVALGYGAVPQLITALDDQRFTRSVGFHRNFYFSHNVLRVADCAEAILARIAGRGFYEATSTAGYMTKDGKSASTKAQVQKWWDGVQKKGDEQVLVEGTERGDDNAVYQAQRLLKKYPGALLDAVTEGVRNATRSWVRTQLIEIAGKINGEAPVPLLLKELKEGPYLTARVAAATALRSRRNAAALPAMIEEWRKLPNTDRSGDDEDPGSLITFLATCEDLKGIQALGNGLRERPVNLRLEVVTAFGETGGFMSSFSTGVGGAIRADGGERTTNAVAEAAIEELLVNTLEDTDERTGMSGTWAEKSYTDPRMCDMAGHVLNQLWPDRYGFDLGASLRVRDEKRFKCINTWRTKHGLAPLPPPVVKATPAAPKEKTDPLLDSIRKAKKAADVSRELKDLDDLGLPALSAVNDCLGRLPEKHPVRDELLSLARRLSCFVDDVVISEKSAKPDEKLANALQDLKGRTLTSDRFIGVLLQFAQTEGSDIAGIKLKAVRNEDLTGVTVAVTHLTNKASQAGSQKGWQTTISVTSGNDTILSSSSVSSSEYGQKREAYEDLAKAIDKVLVTGPKEPFVVNLTLVLEK